MPSIARLLPVAAALVAGCGTQTPERSATRDRNEVAIGLGAVHGSAAYAGVQRGAALAIERLNAGGAIRFRLREPERSLASAVRVAESLRDDPAVIGVVGHPESGRSLEAIPVYADIERNGARAVAAVSPTATSPRLSGISPWFFRVAPSDDQVARFVARFVRDSLAATRAAIVYRNDSYGRDWARTFAETFEDAGGTLTSRDPYLAGVTEWDAYAGLLAAQRPQVVLFPGDAADALEFLDALREERATVAFLGGDGTGDMERSPEATGARFVAFFRPERASGPEADWLLATHAARYGGPPDSFAALAYDATLAIGRVVQQGARTRRAVRDALEQLGRARPPVPGAAGEIAFDTRHDALDRTVAIATIGTPTRPTPALVPSPTTRAPRRGPVAGGPAAVARTPALPR
jgi:branched-chain amino acid transport system substrate-binding protein